MKLTDTLLLSVLEAIESPILRKITALKKKAKVKKILPGNEYYDEFKKLTGQLYKELASEKPHKKSSDSDQKKSIGTEADKGRPDNGMGPPPKENEVFVKKGADLELKDVTKFINEFKPDYVEMQGLGANLKISGAKHFANRLKDKDSLFKKMKGRLKDRSLNTAADVIGARALASSIDKQQSILNGLKKQYDVIEVEDASKKSRPDGYRAIHVLFRTDSGKIAELQIKTHRQQLYSGFTHDTIYKPSPELEAEFSKGDDKRPKNREVADYLNKLSDYLYDLDTGKRKDVVKDRPKEPKILVDNNMLFPWKEVEKLEKGDYSSFSDDEKTSKKTYKDFEKKEAGKVKHFVVVRSPKKENLRIEEFDTFDEADEYVTKNLAKHKGEAPMGYADSKEEFLKVFSEYRPEGWEK